MASIRFFTAALLAIFTFNSFFLQTESVSCCLSYTKRNIHCQKLKGYIIQTHYGICDLDAIIFHTKAGNAICADPSKGQTKRMIQCLNARAESLS